ncbi:efflux RND transporter periplasmic adaptor subunit [Sinomicrobium pectinilyticum]|uniref:Efflux RND transporter periplasmic adaptor subunit n=1 Tax=Sinomicrobium pectinilyticum TaxID=1084421 RepID=A0A3N0F3F2_SINP1|nr:efflux RND transporter periplasmic adaptor subunit [Sinomicrobium pectinilyticum]RNL94512.1 efflux RND transporter periplasmic adaptor subunit [Sinomicrobium pectinilyticum]
MNKKSILIICALILLVTIAIVFLIFTTEPTAKSEAATKKTAMLVSVEAVKEGSFIPEFVATGTVQPIEDVQLSPLVNGQVIQRTAAFVPGGVVKKGHLLLKIDPSDYENQLELRKSELLQAETNLTIEMGRQHIAEQDFALVGADSLSDKQKSLVLRQPQLNAVKAQLQAARAAADQATLNVRRTRISAPFDAQVISQNVTTGSQVTPGDNLGRLVGIDYYWVEVSLPINKLKWLSFPSSDKEQGAVVKISNKTSWGENESRTGYLHKKIGALDQQTRLARLLVKVPDPLGLETPDENIPTLMVGEFVEAHIQGKRIEQVVKLDRNHLRNNRTVWVMHDGKLEIREVNIRLIDANHVYISDGIQGGEKIVTTNISTVTEGVPLRTEKDSVTD